MNICVYCASSSALEPSYFESVRALGALIAERGHTIVYGAGNIGLMGALAQAARQRGGSVTGVIPSFLNAHGLALDGLDELVLTEDMGLRKKEMRERSQAFIACPGGFGTWEEMLEVLTLKQLGQLDHPCVFLNVNGFYDRLIDFFEHAMANKFVKEKYRDLYHITHRAGDALDYIETYESSEYEEKWFSPDDLPERV